LRDKALLMRGVPRRDGTPTFRLHDLLRVEGLSLITRPRVPTPPETLPGLGLTLTEAHALLLDRYRPGERKQNPWFMIPDDGYLYDRLTWHLEQAQRVDEIHDLLWSQNAEGKNGWSSARD